MTIICKSCTSDDDYAKVSLFALEHKREMHPSFFTLDMVASLLTYMMEGHLLFTENESGKVTGISAYYHGTPEEEFQNRHIAILDMAIIDRTYRGSRIFAKGLRYMVEQIAANHPEVEELHFRTLADNVYLRNMYSKIAEETGTRDGDVGKETFFCVKLHRLKATLTSRYKV
jgi:hypothetical protein